MPVVSPAPFTAPGFVVSGGDLVRPLIPRPRAVVEIDHQLREVAAKRRSARLLLGETMALLAELDREEDSLLALRSAESGRRG